MSKKTPAEEIKKDFLNEHKQFKGQVLYDKTLRKQITFNKSLEDDWDQDSPFQGSLPSQRSIEEE